VGLWKTDSQRIRGKDVIYNQRISGTKIIFLTRLSYIRYLFAKVDFGGWPTQALFWFVWGVLARAARLRLSQMSVVSARLKPCPSQEVFCGSRGYTAPPAARAGASSVRSSRGRGRPRHISVSPPLVTEQRTHPSAQRRGARVGHPAKQARSPKAPVLLPWCCLFNRIRQARGCGVGANQTGRQQSSAGGICRVQACRELE
jgi:hypothetical protein